MSWGIQKSLENANLKLKTPVGPLHAELSWAELAELTTTKVSFPEQQNANTHSLIYFQDKNVATTKQKIAN